VKRRSLLLSAPGTLAWSEEALGSPGPGEVALETRTGAMSLGSELPLYLGTARRSTPPRYPFMTGYESLARVIARGPDVTALQEGDRVVAFYGHRSHGLARAKGLIRVPDGIPDDLALLAILSCDVAKGVRKLGLRPEEPALVSGAGAIGLLSLFVLRAYGLRSVDVVEPLAARRRLAARLGARHTFTPEEENALLYPAGLECSGRARAFRLLQRQMEPSGRICVLSDGNLEPLTLSPYFHERELSLVGSSDGWDYPRHAAWFFEVLGEGGGALEALFDLHITANELPATFRRLAGRPHSAIKVLVRYAS
jgi:alcohol dehydrogenase